LCACLARKARGPGEGRRSSPFVSFREGSKIGIGDRLGQLAALIMAVIGRGGGIFRPRGSRFGDGAAAGRPSCGQRRSGRGGSASPGWLPGRHRLVPGYPAVAGRCPRQPVFLDARGCLPRA
jgi:hypothetical protein